MSAMPQIVHKLHDNGDNGLDAGDGFSDFQIDTFAKVIAELRAEWQVDIQAAIAAAMAQLRAENDQAEAVAELRGQMTVLLNFVGNGDLGGNGSKSRSRKAKSEVIRNLTVTDCD